MITTQYPNLEPITNSFERTELETDVKGIFKELFEAYIREQERKINAYGMPHRADIETVERFVKQDGLSLFKRGDTTDPFIKEILRGWRGIHARRGCGFLRFYLQMLWPNSFEIKDLYQIKNVPYPHGLSVIDGANKFLTSRKLVHLYVEQVPDLTEIVKIQSALRQIVPARIVLDIAVFLGFQNSEPDTQIITANVGTTTTVMYFDDTTIDSSDIVPV